MRRALCIWLSDWPIQRLVVARPELEGRPVALDEPHRGARRVAACSARAGALGVAVGMPLAEAKVLAGSAPLYWEPYDPAADREALQKLAEACRRYSPVVALDDSPAPDSLLLDVTGLAPLFGGEAALAAGIIGDFTRRRLAVRVAVAATVGAAWAMARFGRWKGKGFPFIIVPSAQTSAALRPLPVEALRLAGEVVEVLHQLGIDQVGQLEPLPRADLALRFGDQLVRRLDQAAGRLAEPVAACKLPPEWTARWVLEHPTSRRAEIERMVERLIGRVAEVLARDGRGVVQLECRLVCGRAGAADLSVGLFRPSASVSHLFELVRTRLERVSLAAPVAAVEVQAAVTTPLPQGQQTLFSDRPPKEDPRQLASLVDRLTSRLGRRAVVRPRLRSDVQPELACRYDPMVDVGCAGRRRGGSSRAAEAELPPRPLRLFRRPVALAVVSIMPGGPPLRFELRAREHRVAWTSGPERIKTGWWRGRPVGRDYYRVETTAGQRYWLFRRLRDGKWFLHGAFE